MARASGALGSTSIRGILPLDRAHLSPALDMHRLAVTGESRHSNGGGRHTQLREFQDLPGLGNQLPLLLGVAILSSISDGRNAIESDGVGKCRTLHVSLVEEGDHLLTELGHARLTRPGHRLVGRNHNPTDPERIRQRLQGHDQLNRGAVGVRDDPLAAFTYGIKCPLSVDLGDHQRDVGIHSPGRGVVDNYRAGLGKIGSTLSTQAGATAEQGNVDILGNFVDKHVDGNVYPPEGQTLPQAPRRSEEPQRSHGKVPLLQDLDHFPSHSAGSADDRYTVALLSLTHCSVILPADGRDGLRPSGLGLYPSVISEDRLDPVPPHQLQPLQLPLLGIVFGTQPLRLNKSGKPALQLVVLRHQVAELGVGGGEASDEIEVLSFHPIDSKEGGRSPGKEAGREQSHTHEEETELQPGTRRSYGLHPFGVKTG